MLTSLKKWRAAISMNGENRSDLWYRKGKLILRNVRNSAVTQRAGIPGLLSQWIISQAMPSARPDGDNVN